MSNERLAEAIEQCFFSGAVSDINGEEANIVDVLASVARALNRLGVNDAATNMGAIEALSLEVQTGCAAIAGAILDLADAIRESAPK